MSVRDAADVKNGVRVRGTKRGENVCISQAVGLGERERSYN